ncbi:MAG: hypothetical protein KDK78_12205, partial [Chlamydiia bacterium]|nr:hypothetical protein [Chlamydiia bacterium]
MFGRKKAKPENPIYERPTDTKVEIRKKRIRHVLRTQHLSVKDLDIIEPLYGVPPQGIEKDLYGGRGMGLHLSFRGDLHRLRKHYHKLYKAFHMRRLASELASRKGRIDRQLAQIAKDLRIQRKAKEPQQSQITLLENLQRHLETIYAQLKDTRDIMYMVHQLGQSWQRQEEAGLAIRYDYDREHYAYDPADTEGNIGCISELKESLVDKSLSRIDAAIKALVEIGPEVQAVLSEVNGLEAEAKRSIQKTQSALQGGSLTAMDKIEAEEYLENLIKQRDAFSSMGKRAEKAATMLKGEMKSFDPFIKIVGTLHRDLKRTKQEFKSGKKREDYFVKLLKQMDDKTAKLNQAAATSTRMWLLSRFLEPSHTELLRSFGQGRMDTLRGTLELDVYFRDFTSVVSGGKGGASLPKEGIQIMLKDYPYQVRAIAKDFAKVYHSIHESNSIFLKQVSGATGQEEP